MFCKRKLLIKKIFLKESMYCTNSSRFVMINTTVLPFFLKIFHRENPGCRKQILNLKKILFGSGVPKGRIRIQIWITKIPNPSEAIFSTRIYWSKFLRIGSESLVITQKYCISGLRRYCGRAPTSTSSTWRSGTTRLVDMSLSQVQSRHDLCGSG